jgi:shikimate 5-dehydrogenase
VKGKTVLIIGAGGAARAIAYEANRRGAMVLVSNRTHRKARELADELGVAHVRTLDSVPFDILVNATSVGMVPHDDESPAPNAILKGKVVFDAVYNPPMTKLLREAKRRGARIIQGTEMYINQARLQSTLFVGLKPAVRVMRRALMGAAQ